MSTVWNGADMTTRILSAAFNCRQINIVYLMRKLGKMWKLTAKVPNNFSTKTKKNLSEFTEQIEIKRSRNRNHILFHHDNAFSYAEHHRKAAGFTKMIKRSAEDTAQKPFSVDQDSAIFFYAFQDHFTHHRFDNREHPCQIPFFRIFTLSSFRRRFRRSSNKLK